jgi:hypothetical protein
LIGIVSFRRDAVLAAEVGRLLRDDRFRESANAAATAGMGANQPVTVQVFYVRFPPNSVTP